MPKIDALTDAKASKLQLPEKLDKHGQPIKQVDFFETLFEGRSLILSLSYAGTRSWSVMYYDRSRPRRKKLGDFPGMSAKTARKAAREFDVDGALNRSKTGTFKAVAENWFKRHVEGEKLRSAPEIRRHLEKYVYPKWGDRAFADVGRRDVSDLLDDIVDNPFRARRRTDGKAQANAVLATVGKLMAWYEARDETYRSPIVRGMKLGQTKGVKRWLTDDEIRYMWDACGGMGAFGAIVKLLLLTGQRREKVQTMRWADIVGTEWHIPREQREKGNPGTITLPQSALDIINEQPRIAGCPFVFFGRGKKQHFNSFGERKAALDAQLPEMPNWRLHDLRRTARKLMTRAKVPTEVAELALGHSIKGIQAVYDDLEEYRPAIDEALGKVAVELYKITIPESKVIPIRG